MGQISVKKHILECKKEQTIYPYTFVAEYPNHLLGLLIGGKGKNLKDIINRSIYDKLSGEVKINNDDVTLAKNLKLKITVSKYTKDELLNYIEKNQNVSYVGWPLDKNDVIKDHILIKVLFPKNIKHGLNDRNKLILNIHDEILNNIQQILSKNNEDINDIDEEIDDFNFNFE